LLRRCAKLDRLESLLMYEALEFMKKFERLDRTDGSRMKLPLEDVRLDSLLISLLDHVQHPGS
jgi:hypothetical protein